MDYGLSLKRKAIPCTINIVGVRLKLNLYKQSRAEDTFGVIQAISWSLIASIMAICRQPVE